MKNLKITVNGVAYNVQVEEVNGAAPVAAAPAAAPAPAGDAEVVAAPMPGTILSVNVKAGDSVKKGDVLAILEAMKMENEIMAPHDATVAAVHVNKGESVDTGAAIVSLQ